MSFFKVAFQDRYRYPKYFDLPSMTKQSFREECDINNILKRYQKTGVIEHVKHYNGQYGDFTGINDYHSACNRVLAAEEAFSTLPSSLRSRFRNDPGEFLSFVNDPKNLDEMVSLGLATRRAEHEKETVEAQSETVK